jgi:hypothetical protein
VVRQLFLTGWTLQPSYRMMQPRPAIGFRLACDGREPYESPNAVAAVRSSPHCLFASWEDDE